MVASAHKDILMSMAAPSSVDFLAMFGAYFIVRQPVERHAPEQGSESVASCDGGHDGVVAPAAPPCDAGDVPIFPTCAGPVPSTTTIQ